MANLILNGAVVENTVTHLGDEDLLPENGTVTVSQARWQAERSGLVSRGNVGIRIAAGETHAAIVDDLAELALIAIEFEAFKDGRGYSYARLLRERHGYEGEIRAIGDVLHDQLFPMQRCGFNAFEIRADRDAASALVALKDFTERYQPAADEALPLYRRANR